MVAAGLLALSLLPFALGRPHFGSPLVQRSIGGLPLGFSRREHGVPLPPGIHLIIGLPQTNISSLELALTDVSDPNSPQYGQHLSKSDIEKLISPSAESMQAVNDWLNNNGLRPNSTSLLGGIVTVQIDTVEQANKLLHANYSAYVHDGSNTTLLRTMSYSLPADLNDHVSFVYPTTQFIPPPAHKITVKAVLNKPLSQRAYFKRQNPANCSQLIVPKCLQDLYKIPTTPASVSGNLSVTGFLQEVANAEDLKTFLSQERPDITDPTLFDVTAIDGGTNNGTGTTEASLDIQYTVGLATNVPTTFITVGSENQDDYFSGFFDIINDLLNSTQKPPLVLSTSYGFDETFLAEQAPEMTKSLCNMYMALGALGTSVIFSSGDGGVEGSQASGTCEKGDPFVPTFPSSCPYVTSVGSTQGNPEVAASFSAGGFSNLFTQPSYQSAAVSEYIKAIGDTNKGLFNASGRAYPDVSTQGVNFLVQVAGQAQSVQGTSASAPTFASIVALLNDRRLGAGKSPLGFLNPLLYSNATAALNDVTHGSNPGCGTDGFPAATGWDPVTGLGTPDFEKLLSVVVPSSSTSSTSQ